MIKKMVLLILLMMISACQFNFVQVNNIQSKVDFNGNVLDDYSDFVQGARKDAMNHPTYNGDYVTTNNGYPDADVGVCTDVIWRAFKEAGYSLRSMLNNDIKQHYDRYQHVVKTIDSFIDFRRVKSLRPFFEEYSILLETQLNNPEQWQPGDIVIFGPNDKHIGILSNNRNKEGYPLVFHNSGQRNREEDYLKRQAGKITGHYRFDASIINEDVLRKWVEGEDGK